MGCIGRCISRLSAAGIVKAVNQIRIAREAFGRCDIFNAVLCPKPTFIPKGAKTAFSRNACTCKDDYLFHQIVGLGAHLLRTDTKFLVALPEHFVAAAIRLANLL